MAVYTLPDLDYDYGALEPHISGKIMELHHDKHHNTYVQGANTALEKLAEAREKGDFGTINKLEKDLAFNLGGHINHSVFWKNMSPHGGGRPEGNELAAAIDEFFGSFDSFKKKQFEETAKGVQGSGWGMLVWDVMGQRLNTMQLFDHQAICRQPRSRSSSSTCGNTPITCSTRTSRPTTSLPGGTSSTGPTPSSGSSRPVRSPVCSDP